MRKYQLTNRAEDEIEHIYEYSILNFGLDVARDYLTGLYQCFDTLADSPSWGNDYGTIERGLLRYEYRSHSIYYQATEAGILVVRVLGNRQDPARHL